MAAFPAPQRINTALLPLMGATRPARDLAEFFRDNALVPEDHIDRVPLRIYIEKLLWAQVTTFYGTESAALARMQFDHHHLLASERLNLIVVLLHDNVIRDLRLQTRFNGTKSDLQLAFDLRMVWHLTKMSYKQSIEARAAQRAAKPRATKSANVVPKPSRPDIQSPTAIKLSNALSKYYIESPFPDLIHVHHNVLPTIIQDASNGYTGSLDHAGVLSDLQQDGNTDIRVICRGAKKPFALLLCMQSIMKPAPPNGVLFASHKALMDNIQELLPARYTLVYPMITSLDTSSLSGDKLLTEEIHRQFEQHKAPIDILAHIAE